MTASPWREVELNLTASADITDPYTSVEVWADFTYEDGTSLRRPAFYDGGRTWRIRFAGTPGEWHWHSAASIDDPGLAGVTGTVRITDAPSQHRFSTSSLPAVTV